MKIELWQSTLNPWKQRSYKNNNPNKISVELKRYVNIRDTESKLRVARWELRVW